MTSAFVNQLGEFRARRGWTQAELAERTGVSRQTVNALEAGRAEPKLEVALRLAAALETTVDELFALRPGQLAATVVKLGGGRVPAQARVAIGEVDGRAIAHVLPARELSGMMTPADGTLSRSRKVQLFGRALPKAIFVAGCDPALGLLAQVLSGLDRRVVWLPSNSRDALAALAKGQVHVAGTHLGSESVLPQRELEIVRLARWNAGLAVARGNPLRIRRAADLLRTHARVALREPGSGAHALLARELGAGMKRLRGLAYTASGHHDVARLVAAGAADAGVTIPAAAIAYDLSFVPLADEAFDLVMPRDALKSTAAALIDALTSAAFRRQAASLGGYELREAGRVVG